jgi:uncharacterized membrane protein (DUF373 family)
MEKISKLILGLSIKTITIVLLIMLLYSVAESVILFGRAIVNHPLSFGSGIIDKESTFLSVVLSLIGAVLLILIIIEMIELVKDYESASKQDYLILVIEIAIVSLVRHLIVMDFSHYDASTLIGMAFILLVIGAFYLVLRNFKNQVKSESNN